MLSIDLEPRCFMRVVELPDAGRPIMVHREFGVTVVYVDPRENRLAISEALIRDLSCWEQDVMCDAFLVARPGEEGDNSHVINDKLTLLYVPPAIRIPGDEPIQGGAELARRTKIKDGLADEINLLTVELMPALRTG